MKKILIAPLDWGLGHATRCVPIIHELQLQRCEVVVAGSGASLALLKIAFPDLVFKTIPGYHPRYPSGGSMAWTMAFQLPHFLRVIRAEHKAIEVLVKNEHIDLLISDNRYGCWSAAIPSVFITHQSNILMPKRFGWLQRVVRWCNERMINQFDACWIPDLPGEHSLAGDLIAFGKSGVKIETAYIGWLSRFKKKKNPERKYDIVAIFSGPEPQRTILENIVIPQLQASSLNFLAVRGLPAATEKPSDERIVNFLSSDALQDCIAAADVIIARSGYSTVMDMDALGKQVVFIPTPGQTEQVYLAKRLLEKRVAFYMDQHTFNLHTALIQSRKFSGFNNHIENHYLAGVVKNFLDKI